MCSLLRVPLQAKMEAKKNKKKTKKKISRVVDRVVLTPPPLSPFPTTLHPLSLRLLYCTGRKQNHLLESHQVD
jgi:hypothetical protein